MCGSRKAGSQTAGNRIQSELSKQRETITEECIQQTGGKVTFRVSALRHSRLEIVDHVRVEMNRWSHGERIGQSRLRWALFGTFSNLKHYFTLPALLSTWLTFKQNLSIFFTFHNLNAIYGLYIITKSMRALWLVNQLWVIVPVNPWKNRASSELLYKSHLGYW